MQDIGLIFDMDGVIVDNHQYHYLSWHKLAKKYGIDITEEFYRNHMNGRTFMSIIEVIFETKMSEAEAKEKAMEKEAIYRDLYRRHLKPTNGLIPFLDVAKSKGIPMVIGTSAPIQNVDFTLDGLNIRKYFRAILDDRSVTKGKPDPEIYLKCAEVINRPNEKCIVFEDAISGIAAGKAAGSKVVALATSHRREELDADYIYDDFTQFHINRIFEILS